MSDWNTIPGLLLLSNLREERTANYFKRKIALPEKIVDNASMLSRIEA